MIKKLLLIAFFFNSAICADGIEKYFKTALNKADGHLMPGIDFIYMINLDQRPEKYESTINELQPYGIVPYRFSAVNGWELSFEALEELGVFYEPGTPEGPICSVYRHVGDKEYMSFEIMKEPGISYFIHSMSRGAIGIILSHLSVLQDAYDSGYNTIWVMEDDIKVVSNPHELSTMITTLDSLAPDWDVFFTDPETKGSDGNRVYCGGIRPRPNFALQSLAYYVHRSYLNEDIMKMGLRFGTYSMIIRRSGMKKLLDFFKANKLFFPYDLDCFYPTDIKFYACRRDIVTTTAGGLSDNGGPTYKK
jgi:GR25 family glycosyltransferase involved in LPS biosynthesis